MATTRVERARCMLFQWNCGPRCTWICVYLGHYSLLSPHRPGHLTQDTCQTRGAQKPKFVLRPLWILRRTFSTRSRPTSMIYYSSMWSRMTRICLITYPSRACYNRALQLKTYLKSHPVDFCLELAEHCWRPKKGNVFLLACDTSY